MSIRFIACAHPDHPLHHLGRELTLDDLKSHRQLVVRDSGSRSVDSGWLGAEQRWTLSDLDLSLMTAQRGIGYAWYPETRAHALLDSGQLKPLPLTSGGERWVELYLILTEGELTRPGVKQLAQMIKDHANSQQEFKPVE